MAESYHSHTSELGILEWIGLLSIFATEIVGEVSGNVDTLPSEIVLVFDMPAMFCPIAIC